MPRRARRQSGSSLYHVMNRGAGKQIIFEDDADKAFFLKKATALLDDHRAALVAYCLMDNHFHLVLRIPFEELSAYMHRLQTSYAGYFNRVHEHTGLLFGSRFRSETVDTDAYFMVLIRYVHENPVKARMPQGLNYRWSSYGEYKDIARNIDPEIALSVFGGKRQLLAFHQVEHGKDDCMDYNESLQTSLSDEQALLEAQDVLGGEGVLAVKGMDRAERNAAIVRLRERGLGVRQIQRLTGVPRSVISRVTAGMTERR